LGVVGTIGDPGANEYFKHADFVIALGNSFAHNATWKFQENLYDSKVLMHINIDRHEINKVYEADYGMISDIKPAIVGITQQLARQVTGIAPAQVIKDKWYNQPIEYTGQVIHPGAMVKILSEHLPADTIVLGDAGGHMLWLCAYMSLNEGQIYQNPGTFGPMAVHVNGAIGVKCANPNKVVVSACGDGAYLMGGFELLTAVQHNIPVVWVIFNNGGFNIIKQFLLAQFGEAPYMDFINPDYVMYAKSCGAEGYRVEKLEEFGEVFEKALRANRPVLIDVVLDPDVYPPFHGKGI
jgi:acetolactate synthase-1/2/3 large subunit